jgi:hypothetical protein
MCTGVFHSLHRFFHRGNCEKTAEIAVFSEMAEKTPQLLSKLWRKNGLQNLIRRLP